MCGCECCNSGNPTCFDPSKVDTWASCKALVCGCTCGGCLSRAIDGAFQEGMRLGKWAGLQAALDAVAACKTHIRRRNTARHNGWFSGRTNWYAVKIITVDRDAVVDAIKVLRGGS